MANATGLYLKILLSANFIIPLINFHLKIRDRLDAGWRLQPFSASPARVLF